jgi:predicted ABC-type ATPase
MFESFISDSARGIAPMKGFEDAPEGSWFGSFKVDSEDAWSKVKSGEVKGFSVEGVFEYAKQKSKDEVLMSKIYKILEQVDFGGPGSGRRPEGGTEDETGGSPSAPSIKYDDPEVLSKSVDEILSKAPKYGTQEIYSKDGVYNDDRQKFHKEVVDDYIKGGSTTTGTSYFMGGAPATGKSSIINSGDVVLPKGILVVDSDAVKGKLPEYNEMINRKEPAAAARAHEESSTLSKSITKTAAKNGFDIVNDGVGDGKYDSIVSKVKEQRDAGKKVVANYVTTDTEVSLQRARQRGEKSGRVVPEQYIKDMHKEISNLVPKLASNKVFDELRLYDNNGSKPKLIFEQKGTDIKVLDKVAYQKFLDKQK